MTTLSKKRILVDIKNFSKDNTPGIYAYFDEEDIYKAKAMIIGPEDTPYSGGFYFFDIEFPKQYPLYPPKVLFKTLDNRIRFNPNLYKEGKVCVSILGTWSGPGWTSVMTFTNVVISIQSLLNNRPIQNEPGWENEVGERCEKYNKIINYFNYEVAMLKMMKHTPPGFEVFKDDMINHLDKNIDTFITRINNNIHLDSTEIRANIYSLYLKPDYKNMIERFKYLKNELNIGKKNKIIIEPINKEPAEKNESVKKNTRKSPNIPSKKYPIGTIVKSENDGNMWKVIKFKENSTKWILDKIIIT